MGKEIYTQDKEWMWSQFIRLGDRIGDGDYEPYMVKEYKRLMKILCPPTEEEKAIKSENRRKKNENMDKQIKERLEKDKCSKCNSALKQTRKGSKIVQCINEECKAKWQYKSKKK